MTLNVIHDAPNWGMPSSYDLHNSDMITDLRSEEFGQPPLMVEKSPLVMTGDLDPWIMERFGCNGEAAPMSGNTSGQWDSTYVGSEYKEYKEQENCELTSWSYAHIDSGNSVPHWDGSGRENMSQLATERALFMTPSAYPLPFSTFPGSPISDLSSTPDMSHASSGLWETDVERDNAQSFLPATTETYMQAPSESRGTAPGYSSGEDEDNYPTILEMPDGSTRRTSNWLPVDPQAGFTIDSHTRERGHSSYMHLECVEDVQGAFISPNTAGWKYEG